MANDVVGVHGSLYQYCESSLGAHTRVMQAWAIPGLVATLPPTSVCAETTERWLAALENGTFPTASISRDDLPRINDGAVVPVVFDEPDRILDGHPPGPRQWLLYRPGEEIGPAHDFMHALPVPPGLGPRRVASRTPSPDSALQRAAAASLSLSPLGGPSRLARISGYVCTVVYRGPTPWIYWGE